MNKENILKVADAIENGIEGIEFDMYFPLIGNYRDNSGEPRKCRACVAGFAKFLSGNMDMTTFTAGALYMGLHPKEIREIFHVVSMGESGSNTINKAKSLVPAALRWMVANDDINWHRAFEGVMLNNARSV